jgi:DNA-binding transcriptional MerR regulator
MPQSTQTLRIGEVARLTGITVATLRYYERLKLLPPPTRSAGGFRHYAPEVVSRVRFIKCAQDLGFSLEDIRGISNDASRAPGKTCRGVYDLLTRHLGDIDQLLTDLRELRSTLDDHRQRCETALHQQPDVPCPTIEALERHR